MEHHALLWGTFEIFRHVGPDDSSNLPMSAFQSVVSSNQEHQKPTPTPLVQALGLVPVVPRTVCQAFLLVLLRNLSEAGDQTRCVQDQSMSYPGLYLFLFRVTLSSAQTLLLALHTGITSGRLRGCQGWNWCARQAPYWVYHHSSFTFPFISKAHAGLNASYHTGRDGAPGRGQRASH